MPVDLLESGFQFPPKVYILAPGPNGRDYWDNVGCYCIAVNKAINIPLPVNVWMVSDWWALKTPWFYEGLWRHDVCYMFSEGLVSKLPEYDVTLPVDYSFKLLDGRQCVKPLGTGLYEEPLPDRFRPDGSVSMTAIEAATRCGAKEIVLCGIDMEGNTYHDGKHAKDVHCDRSGEWPYFPFANSLIKWVKEQGVDIWSLSPTKLEL